MSKQAQRSRTPQTFAEGARRLGLALCVMALLGGSAGCDVKSDSGTHVATSTLEATASTTADPSLAADVRKNNDATLETVKTWFSKPQTLLTAQSAQLSQFTNGAPNTSDTNVHITYPSFAGISRQNPSTREYVYYPSSTLSPQQKNRLSPSQLDALIKNGGADETYKVALNLGVIENDSGFVTSWAGGYQLSNGDVFAVWYSPGNSDEAAICSGSFFFPAGEHPTDNGAQLKANVGRFIGMEENNDLEVQAYYATQANPNSVKKFEARAAMIAGLRQMDDFLITGNRADLKTQSVSYGVYNTPGVTKTYSVNIDPIVVTAGEEIALPTTVLVSGAILFHV